VSTAPVIKYRCYRNKLLPVLLTPMIRPCPVIFIDFMTPAITTVMDGNNDTANEKVATKSEH
jgi:hypothetical protein